MKKYYKFVLDMKLMNTLVLILCIVLMFIAFNFNTGYVEISTGKNAPLFFVGMFIYFGLHEICHGIGYYIFANEKKKIKFGVMLEKGVLYAMCQDEISKKGIIISLLFPIIFLTIVPIIIGLIFSLKALIIYAIINFVGAIGDITMLLLILKFPSDIKYIDYDNVIGAYFLSKKDLSIYKSIGMRYIESGIHNKKLINEDIKKIYISKISWIIIIILVIFLILSFMWAL